MKCFEFEIIKTTEFTEKHMREQYKIPVGKHPDMDCNHMCEPDTDDGSRHNGHDILLLHADFRHEHLTSGKVFTACQLPNLPHGNKKQEVWIETKGECFPVIDKHAQIVYKNDLRQHNRFCVRFTVDSVDHRSVFMALVGVSK